VVDLATDVAARELAVLHVEDRLSVVRWRSQWLLLVPTPMERLVEHLEQIRPPAQDLIVSRDRACDLAQAAILGNAEHKQANHVRGIGVEVEALVRLVAAALRRMDIDPDIAHIAQDIAVFALRYRGAEMAAD